MIINMIPASMVVSNSGVGTVAIITKSSLSAAVGKWQRWLLFLLMSFADGSFFLERKWIILSFDHHCIQIMK